MYKLLYSKFFFIFSKICFKYFNLIFISSTYLNMHMDGQFSNFQKDICIFNFFLGIYKTHMYMSGFL